MVPLLLVFAAAPTAAADAPALLARARAQVADLKYRDAERTLQPVAQATGLSRAEVLAFFELEARIAGTLGRPEEAVRWFERLVELDPTFSLGERAAPKLSGPLFEARAAVDKRGPLAFSVRVTEAQGRVVSLTPSLTGPTERVAKVALVLEQDGARREQELAPGALVAMPVSAKELVVGARLLDARGWTLVEHTSRHAATPVLEPEPAVVTPTPEPAPSPRLLFGAAPPEAPAPAPRFRGLAWASIGVAVAAGIAGGVLYGLGFDATQRFNAAVAGRQGTLLSITQAQAQQLDATARLGGLGSTTSWAAAGGFLVTGIVLWILGVPPEAK